MGRLPRIPRRAVAAALCAAGLLLAAPRAGAAQGGAAATPPQFEKGLFDMRIGELLTVTSVGLINERGAILLPVDAILSFTGLPILPESNDSARFIPTFGNPNPAILDLRRRNIRRLGMVYPLAIDEATAIGGEWYLASERLEEFLGARVLTDMSSLQVFISRDPPFPAEQNQTTLERRAVYGVGPRAIEPFSKAPFLRRTGGIGVDWALSSSGSFKKQDAGLQLQMGGAVFGGALSAATRVTRTGVDREAVKSTWQYTFATPATEWLRTVQFGNVAAATSGRSVLGTVLSNQRPFRTGAFTTLKLLPDAPAGWSYDVFQDGQLIGFSDATSRTPVPVQLGYGSTPVEIRYHGPAGEEIRTNYVYQVDIERLAPGKIEFNAGAGECARVKDCRLAFGNIAAGLRSWMTASVGHEMVDSTGQHNNFFGRLLLSNVTGWKAVAEYTPAVARATISYFGTGNVTGSLAGGWVGENSPVASYTSAIGRRRFVEPTLNLPVARLSNGAPVTLRFQGRADIPEDTGSTQIVASTTISVSQLQGTVQYADDIAAGVPQITTSALWLTPESWGRLGRNPISGSVVTQRGGVKSALVGFGLGAGGRSSLNIDMRWTREDPRAPTLSLSYNAYTGQYRRALGITGTPGRDPTTNALVGSLTEIDPRFGIVSTDRASANTAGLAGQVYYDENGNGVFDTGDRRAEGTIIHIEGTSVTSRANGVYKLIGIAPYEPVRISVDTVSGVDPSYLPSIPDRRVRLSPNVLTRMDVPLVKTREIVGAITTTDTLIATTAGVTLQLRETTTGQTYVTSTFSDGTYYVGRVTPGTYQLTVAARSLEALKATVVGGSVTLKVDAAGAETIQAPTLVLRSTPSGQ